MSVPISRKLDFDGIPVENSNPITKPKEGGPKEPLSKQQLTAQKVRKALEEGTILSSSSGESNFEVEKLAH